jgi:hypothetical protein
LCEEAEIKGQFDAHPMRRSVAFPDAIGPIGKAQVQSGPAAHLFGTKFQPHSSACDGYVAELIVVSVPGVRSLSISGAVVAYVILPKLAFVNIAARLLFGLPASIAITHASLL